MYKLFFVPALSGLGLLLAIFLLRFIPEAYSVGALVPKSSASVLSSNVDPGNQVVGTNTIPSPQPTLSPVNHTREQKNDKREVSIASQHFSFPVLMYHYIRVNPDPKDAMGADLSVTPENFQKQMDYIVQHGYHTISLDEYAASLQHKFTMPDKPVIIVLDDGYADAHDVAFPILRDKKLKATLLIVTGFVGRPGYVTWDQVDEMKNSGLITYAAHSITHRNLVLIKSSEAKNEVTESKKVLEQKVGYPINWFAYPYGAVNKSIVDFVRQAGFVGALGTNQKTYFDPNIIYSIPRNHIRGTDTISDFAAKLQWH